MASKKQLLIDVLNSEHPTVNGVAVVENKHVEEKGENWFRVETTRPATEENKKKHGPDLPDDRIIAEYLVLNDKEANADGKDATAEVFKGGIPTADKKYKVFRLV